jgi:hypothetical protein
VPKLGADELKGDLRIWLRSRIAFFLHGLAALALKYCDLALELAPDDGGIHDIRGVARALSGDSKGAIEDFQFSRQWAPNNGHAREMIDKRSHWVQELKAGRNPFDTATLETLRQE